MNNEHYIFIRYHWNCHGFISYIDRGGVIYFYIWMICIIFIFELCYFLLLSIAWLSIWINGCDAWQWHLKKLHCTATRRQIQVVRRHLELALLNPLKIYFGQGNPVTKHIGKCQASHSQVYENMFWAMFGAGSSVRHRPTLVLTRIWGRHRPTEDPAAVVHSVSQLHT